MRKILRYAVPVTGMLFILLFCISAAASITDAPAIITVSVGGPVKMLLIGVGFIGFSNFIRKKTL